MLNGLGKHIILLKFSDSLNQSIRFTKDPRLNESLPNQEMLMGVNS